MPRTNMNLPFPKTREEAEDATKKIKMHCLLRGCTCRSLKIEFIEPPGEPGYTMVGHEERCYMYRQS